MSKPVIITCAPTGGIHTPIKDACDAVLNISTGGGLGMTREERLRAAVATSPEMASLNVGSLKATPTQARERLALKGADRVTF